MPCQEAVSMRVSDLQGFRDRLKSQQFKGEAMRLNFRTDFPAAAERTVDLGRRGPIAAAIALTRTVKDAQGAIKQEMGSVFDRPTNYTLNGTFIKSATKDSLVARVWVKDNPFGKGTPADRFLGPQIFGGQRGLKGMERMLQANGLMPQGWYAVPGEGADIDANGNMRRGQIRQMLSQLKVQQGSGYESRATGSKRSNRTITRQGVTYFALPNGNKGLVPGVYAKRRFALGTAIRPVLIFVQAVEYKKRLPFHEVGQATAEARFPVHFEAEFNRPRPGPGR